MLEDDVDPNPAADLNSKPSIPFYPTVGCLVVRDLIRSSCMCHTTAGTLMDQVKALHFLHQTHPHLYPNGELRLLLVVLVGVKWWEVEVMVVKRLMMMKIMLVRFYDQQWCKGTDSNRSCTVLVWVFI